MRIYSHLRVIAKLYGVSAPVLAQTSLARKAQRAAGLAYRTRVEHACMLQIGMQYDSPRAVQLRQRVAKLESGALALVEGCREVAAQGGAL